MTTGPTPQVTELTAVQVLQQAETIAAIHGDTPGESAALIGWYTALLYASGTYPEDPDEWEEWVLDRHPLDGAATWLAEHLGCWNLFDPHRPLGQNAALLPHLDTYGTGPAQLVTEHAGDYNQHFDHHHLHAGPIPAAQAWRAMLAQHSFAQGRRAKIKAKDMGFPAPFTNLSTARLGHRIHVLALGPTLGDTLRLNLAPWDSPNPGTLNLSWGDRTRRAFARPARDEARIPDGPADYHSALGRSVALRPTLLPDGEIGVDRVLVGPGDVLTDLPAAYRQDEVTIVKSGKPGPLKPQPSRELWRESHALYAAVADRTKGNDLYARLATAREQRPQLWAIGLLAKQGNPIAWVADAFPFVPGREIDLRNAAEQGSAMCEYTDTALNKAAYTAWQVAYPNPKPADKAAQLARFDGRAEMWAEAGPAFHALLDATADGHPLADSLTVFGRHIRDIATNALTNRLTSLPATGQGLQARARAHARLTTELNHPKAPEQLKENQP